MKKKIGLSLLVVAAAALLIAGYALFGAPKAAAGAKTVTVQVVAEERGVRKTFTFHTSRSYVAELLEDQKSGLQAEMQDGKYGKFVSGLLGVKANSKAEYFNVKVDGKDAAVGVSQLPLENGKTYTFTLTKL